jgi:hypothetical protein
MYDYARLIEPFCFKGVIGAVSQMPLRAHTPNFEPASLLPAARPNESKDLTPEQDYRVRAMGEEELELLRAAASQHGLQLATLNWILASLANHGFVTISSSTDRRLRAVATKAGYLALALRPALPVDNVH